MNDGFCANGVASLCISINTSSIRYRYKKYLLEVLLIINNDIATDTRR